MLQALRSCARGGGRGCARHFSKPLASLAGVLEFINFPSSMSMNGLRRRKGLEFYVSYSSSSHLSSYSSAKEMQEAFREDEVSRDMLRDFSPPLHHLVISKQEALGTEYDCVVVGGGHAGTEAAAASARMGARTLLITQKVDTVGEMSCNPSIGGIGKGHLVREIDALDGVMGIASDRAGIHFRMLNTSKGPAVWGPRAQEDRRIYRESVQTLLAETPNLSVIEASVMDITLDEDVEVGEGVDCEEGNRRVRSVAVVFKGEEHLAAAEVRTRTAILTTGTFLSGTILLGPKRFAMGRFGDEAHTALSRTLARLQFPLGRLKTGTPPRLDGSTIDYSGLEVQHPDTDPHSFSFLPNTIRVDPSRQLPCHITYTNTDAHDVINANAHLSPYFEEASPGAPRYCPSIETKLQRFAHRARHQIFLEPESETNSVVYPSGISNCLPEQAQIDFLRKIAGLERVRMIRPGYAVEYDFVEPNSLWPSLETKKVGGLFFAGQINGTTGYEEAAAQGLVAGANAAIVAKKGVPVPATLKNREDWFVLGRADAYIGVLVDDLITRGVDEPYRMFTSRAEYRITLRADNADERLTELGYKYGVVRREERVTAVQEKHLLTQKSLEELRNVSKSCSDWLAEGFNVRQDGRNLTAEDVLKRGYTVTDIRKAVPGLLKGMPKLVVAAVEIETKYREAVEKQTKDIQLYKKEEDMRLPLDFNYDNMEGLSNEEKEKLRKFKPTTLAAASRIPGMTPSSLVSLLRLLKRTGDIGQAEVSL